MLTNSSENLIGSELLKNHKLTIDYTNKKVDKIISYTQDSILKNSLKEYKKNFSSTLSHLIKFNADKPDILIKDITKQFCFKFKNYLDRQDLLNSSKNSYLQKFKEVIGFLIENKHINENPIRVVPTRSRTDHPQ